MDHSVSHYSFRAHTAATPPRTTSQQISNPSIDPCPSDSLYARITHIKERTEESYPVNRVNSRRPQCHQYPLFRCRISDNDKRQDRRSSRKGPPQNFSDQRLQRPHLHLQDQLRVIILRLFFAHPLGIQQARLAILQHKCRSCLLTWLETSLTPSTMGARLEREALTDSMCATIVLPTILPTILSTILHPLFANPSNILRLFYDYFPPILFIYCASTACQEANQR